MVALGRPADVADLPGGGKMITYAERVEYRDQQTGKVTYWDCIVNFGVDRDGSVSDVRLVRRTKPLLATALWQDPCGPLLQIPR